MSPWKHPTSGSRATTCDKPPSSSNSAATPCASSARNYGLAIGVNLLDLIAGAGGAMNPVLAALRHNTSSIAVVANSARRVSDTPISPRPTRTC